MMKLWIILEGQLDFLIEGEPLVTGTVGDMVAAINAHTGKLVWYFQNTSHDIYDSDATETPNHYDPGLRSTAGVDGEQFFALASGTNVFAFGLQEVNP